MTNPLRLLLVGDSDSQLLACSALCRFPSTADVAITVNAIPRMGTPAAILERVAEIGGELWGLEQGQLLRHPKLMQFDAIGVYLTGSKIAEFRHSLSHLPGRNRPVLFCGFNGVVLERFEEAISWRLGYDLICLNGPRDQAALLRQLQGTPFVKQMVVLTGLGRYHSGLARGKELGKRPRRIVFAEQVVMPARKEERQRMVRILAELATRSPKWEILIRPRIATGESTFHLVDSHISQTVLETLGKPPVNLKVVYTAMHQLLKQARLLATVSSTAFFDALDHGCRPVVMADLGLQTCSGSHVFSGSGVSRSLNAIIDLDSLETELPWPSNDWLEWMGYGPTYQPGNLLEAIINVKTNSITPLHLAKAGYVINAHSLRFKHLRPSAQKNKLAKILKIGNQRVTWHPWAPNRISRLVKKLRIAIKPRK